MHSTATFGAVTRNLLDCEKPASLGDITLNKGSIPNVVTICQTLSINGLFIVPLIIFTLHIVALDVNWCKNGKTTRKIAGVHPMAPGKLGKYSGTWRTISELVP